MIRKKENLSHRRRCFSSLFFSILFLHFHLFFCFTLPIKKHGRTMGSRRSFGMLLRVSALCAVVDIAAGQTERQPTSNSPRPRGERQWPSLPPVLIQSENWPKPNSWKRSGVLQAGEHGSYDGAVGTDSKVSKEKFVLFVAKTSPSPCRTLHMSTHCFFLVHSLRRNKKV